MLCNLCNLRSSSSGANFLIGRMLNGGNGVSGEPKQHSDVQQDDVIFPLQDTDPEEEESPSSAASTAFRQDLSDSQRNDDLANGGSNLASDAAAALCTCDDGEVRMVLPRVLCLIFPEFEMARKFKL